MKDALSKTWKSNGDQEVSWKERKKTTKKGRTAIDPSSPIIAAN